MFQKFQEKAGKRGCLNWTEQAGYGYFLKHGETIWPEYWHFDGEDSRIHTCYAGISGFFTSASMPAAD